MCTPPESEQSAAETTPKATSLGRNSFEDDFPTMFQFYRERGTLSDFQMQKVHDIQRRWKAGLVFWLTHDNQEVEIPEWVAVNVIINNKDNIIRGSRICMSLNHTKGYGCNRRLQETCNYVHECALCGQEDHGVFQKKTNGSWVCSKLRKWNEEEERFQSTGYGDPWKQEEVLTALAWQERQPKQQPCRGPPDDGTVDDPQQCPGDDAAFACQGGCSQQPPPPTQPPPPPLPANWQAMWCESQHRYYFWHALTNLTQWEVPPLDESEQQVLHDGPAPAAVVPGQQYVCLKHWRPNPGIDSCLRLFHGDRVLITWSSGEETGWAYGHSVDDPSRSGYFPRELLVEAKGEPQRRTAEEIFAVAQPFEAPEVSGYLTIEPGDELRVLYTVEPPSPWTYVERLGQGAPSVGWVPEAVLCDLPLAKRLGRGKGP
mmetsp:Transcript_14981/g.32952  ORF Transcript_14981/g.32952 Transcript_14981/m.32952 type:complete len:429 (+) Transcript_14981:94-1380(+)|eukprot:CAMPEP_0170613868 /NCGR_PEP_ID=MMETSP0224-20130122/24498_1 /TAXON_ID=285029 /ORGANISM="Togula jolla, Strain CCCM 725" /LENGTH=428 /DNA_ID=CAMNT_0010939491 /DNA_START=35 /DNA_END=1321 /DNA_ORIENTATION=-